MLTIALLAVALICVVFVLSYKQRQWRKEESSIHRLALSEAERFFKIGDIIQALVEAKPLLDSEYVKREAQLLIDSILVAAQDKVNQYTDKIQSDPEDEKNYFLRAQQYYYLDEDEKAHADMDRYRAILNPPRGTEAYDDWLKSLAGQEAPYGFHFGTPMNLGPAVNTIHEDHGPCISYDGLTLYFSSNRPGGFGRIDIWVTTRTTRDTSWGRPVNLGQPVNTSFMENHPRISADELSLYFSSDRPNGYGNSDIWISKRATRNDPWQEPENLGETVNSPGNDMYPSVPSDELELYFYSAQPGGYGKNDIWMSKRATRNDPWQEPKNLGEIINTIHIEGHPSISPDGLALFFNSTRTGDDHLWMTTRPSRLSTWRKPLYLESVVKLGSGSSISGDGRIFAFASKRPGDIGFGALDNWEVPVEPIVDFNGDGSIDADDLQILKDNWGTSESLCDIGPMPWGDGVVDKDDLEVYMRYLKQENMTEDLE